MSQFDDDDLSGFEDYIKSYNLKVGQNFRTTSSSNEPDMLTFLEDEAKRLEIMVDFFENKLRNIRTYSQVETLKDKQEEHNDNLREELIKVISDESSEFQNNMRTLFNQFFKELN